MMVKWANDSILQANDGEILLNDGEMLLNDGDDHILNSPSFTHISPSSTSILPSLAWSKLAEAAPTVPFILLFCTPRTEVYSLYSPGLQTANFHFKHFRLFSFIFISFHSFPVLQ